MRKIALAAALSMLAGCTWVTVRPEAENVRLATAEEVTGCERRGKTTSQVAAKVGLFERGEEKVAEELAILARNEASGLGGNTVVPESAATDGRQVFGVYACASD